MTINTYDNGRGLMKVGVHSHVEQYVCLLAERLVLINLNSAGVVHQIPRVVGVTDVTEIVP